MARRTRTLLRPCTHRMVTSTQGDTEVWHGGESLTVEPDVRCHEK
jgi:hypothetical protein